MKPRRTVLTQQEREVLILTAKHPGDRQLSIAEIARRLGLSLNAVKTVIHRACLKLEAHNRNEAIVIAVRRGEIRIDELLPLDELAETLGSLGPAGLRRIARLVRQGEEDGYLPQIEDQFIPEVRGPGSILTNREHDVLLLVGRGLTNKQVADRLCMSTYAVRNFLNGAFAKLGARRRAEAIMLALKREEIGMTEMYSPNEILQNLARLGPASIEKMAQLLEQKQGKEPVSNNS